MSSAPRYNPHYTVTDYQNWQGDWELWNGVAVSMSPSPTRQHQHVLFQLALQIQEGLASHEACHCEVVIDVDWRVSDDTVVRPDLSVVCTATKSDYVYEAPTLVAEIMSPSTAQKDKNEKRHLYANQGVRWYLIIDPDSQAISILQKSEGAGYVDAHWAPNPARIELHEGCSFDLDRDKLFT